MGGGGFVIARVGFLVGVGSAAVDRWRGGGILKEIERWVRAAVGKGGVGFEGDRWAWVSASVGSAGRQGGRSRGRGKGRGER